MSESALTRSIDAFEDAPDPAVLLGPSGAIQQANAAFRAAFPHAVGARRQPWGRIEPPPFVDGRRRFEAPAPDGRLYEWAERRLSDGSSIAFARDANAKVTLFTAVPEYRRPCEAEIVGRKVMSLWHHERLSRSGRVGVLANRSDCRTATS